MKKTILVLAAVALLLPFGAREAQASLLTLRVTSDTLSMGVDAMGNPILLDLTIVDGGAGDTDTVINDSISAARTFNEMDFFATVGASAPLPGDLGRLILNVFHMQNSGAADVTVLLTKGGLDSQGYAQASATGDFFGTLQGQGVSTVSAQSWVNGAPVYAPGANPMFATGGVDALGNPIENFAFTDTELITNLAGNFVLSTEIALDFSEFGGILSITDANVEVTPVASVPEPGSLVLFGSGLIGLATVVRRKSKKQSEVAS